MNSIAWSAAPDGRYWIDVILGSVPARLMLDTGLVDPLHQVAFELEPQVYDQLKQSGQLIPAGHRKRRDASGRSMRMQSGWVAARLFDTDSASAVGPRVQLCAWRGFSNVPSRVGVPFFH